MVKNIFELGDSGLSDTHSGSDQSSSGKGKLNQYRIFGGRSLDFLDKGALEQGIREIDDNIEGFDPEVLVVINAKRSEALALLLDKGVMYNSEWLGQERTDRKPSKSHYDPVKFSFSGKDHISLHIPGLEINMIMKRRVDSRYLFTIRLVKHGEETEISLTHPEYNLLKKFIGELGGTVKIINSDRYTLESLFKSIGPGIIGNVPGTNRYGIPTRLTETHASPTTADDNSIVRDEDGNVIPEFVRRLGKTVKNPAWVARVRELRMAGEMD